MPAAWNTESKAAVKLASRSCPALSGNDEHLIGTVLADAGYATDADLAAPGPSRVIALGQGRDQSRAQHGNPPRARHPRTSPPARPWHTACEPAKAKPTATGAAQPGTSDRKPQKDPRPVLTPRTGRRPGRTLARRNRLRPYDVLPRCHRLAPPGGPYLWPLNAATAFRRWAAGRQGIRGRTRPALRTSRP
jgi:hypothetical protein